MTKYGYVKITRVKTKTVHQGDRRAPKIIIQLSKTDDFDELYDKFRETVTQKIENDIKEGRRPARENGYKGRRGEGKYKNSEREGEEAPKVEAHKDEEEASTLLSSKKDEKEIEDPKSNAVNDTTPKDDLK